MYKYSQIFSFLLFIVLSISSCREEIPIENNDDTDNIFSNTEYLYVGNLRLGEIYKIDIESDSVVDTFNNIELTINGAVTSRDGQKMYVTTFGGLLDVVYGFNLEDGTQNVISYSTSHLYSSPEGDIIMLSFINNKTRTKIGLIDPATDLITYIDTLELKYSVIASQKCAIDGNGKYLFACNTDGRLIKYNFLDTRVERIYNTEYLLENLVLSNDGRKLYNSGGNIIDVESGDIVAELPVFENAHLALTPNDRFLYITDPTGKNENGFLPTAKIYLYDNQLFGVTQEISVHGYVNYLTYTDEISITSEGTKAYVSGFRHLFVIDLVNNVTTGFVNLSEEINPTAMFIGN